MKNKLGNKPPYNDKVANQVYANQTMKYKYIKLEQAIYSMVNIIADNKEILIEEKKYNELMELNVELLKTRNKIQHLMFNGKSYVAEKVITKAPNGRIIS
jgi:hypothetical protein